MNKEIRKQIVELALEAKGVTSHNINIADYLEQILALEKKDALFGYYAIEHMAHLVTDEEYKTLVEYNEDLKSAEKYKAEHGVDEKYNSVSFRLKAVGVYTNKLRAKYPVL